MLFNFHTSVMVDHCSCPWSMRKAYPDGPQEFAQMVVMGDSDSVCNMEYC